MLWWQQRPASEGTQVLAAPRPGGNGGLCGGAAALFPTPGNWLFAMKGKLVICQSACREAIKEQTHLKTTGTKRHAQI